MASQNLYFEPTPLDRQAHKYLRIKPLQDFSFANHLHSSVLGGSEFFAASHHFPVLFIRNNQEKITPIAVLTLLNKGHTLGNTWDGLYVPAYVRRYPFIMDSKDSVLFFDKHCPSLQEKEGEPLFKEDGSPTEILNEILLLNKQVDSVYKMTETYVEALIEKDLLKPYEGKVKVNETDVPLSHYLVVDEKKFHNNLSDTEISDWFKKGWIAWTYAHLNSLQSMTKVIQRINVAEQQTAADQTETA